MLAALVVFSHLARLELYRKEHMYKWFQIDPYCWKHPYGLVFFVFSPKKISHLRRAFRRAEQELCRLGLPAEELALRTVEGFGGG